MGWPSYFLIVADFVNWAKNSDIVVGPGRGSAAGSLVWKSVSVKHMQTSTRLLKTGWIMN
jgi:DNA polymerase-3 subunit alpha